MKRSFLAVVCLWVTVAWLLPNRAVLAQQTAVATPRADGSLVHIVQPGDSLWQIAIRYAPVIQMTPEDALVHIRELNHDPAFIRVGQELLIGRVPDPEPLAETADLAEADEIEVKELAATPTPAPPPTATLIPLGTICVLVFADENENGRQDGEEGIVADVAVTIKRDGQPLTTFVTTPADIRDCVEDLEPGNYQVVITPLGQYRPTTTTAWATALQGSILSVAFGIVAEPTTPTPISTTAPTAVPTPTPTLLGGVGTPPLLIGVGILLLVVLVGGLLLRRVARRS